MDHPLAMDIQQPPGDAFELSGAISSVTCGASGGKPYKLEPVCISVCLDELVYVPIDHPI